MRRLSFTFALLCALAPGLSAASYEYWLTGNPADAKPAKTRAGLFLSGGGGDVTAAWKWFVACAGGGDEVKDTRVAATAGAAQAVAHGFEGGSYQEKVATPRAGARSRSTASSRCPARVTWARWRRSSCTSSTSARDSRRSSSVPARAPSRA